MELSKGQDMYQVQIDSSIRLANVHFTPFQTESFFTFEECFKFNLVWERNLNGPEAMLLCACCFCEAVCSMLSAVIGFFIFIGNNVPFTGLS